MDLKKYLDLSSAEQFEQLETKVLEKVSKSMYDENEIKPYIDKELKLIKENDWALDFLIATEIKHQISFCNRNFCFVGAGCSSVVANVMGISFDIDPLESGLIFERSFRNGHNELYEVFVFFIDNEEFASVLEEIKIQIPNAKVDTIKEETYMYHIVSINKVKIAFYVDKDSLFRTRHDIIDSMDIRKHIYFQEDFMNFLHFSCGYDYDTANEIRLNISKNKSDKMTEIKQEIIDKLPQNLSINEKQEYIDSLCDDLKYSRCKAFFISVMVSLI